MLSGDKVQLIIEQSLVNGLDFRLKKVIIITFDALIISRSTTTSILLILRHLSLWH